jgi:hypothetical protein
MTRITPGLTSPQDIFTDTGEPTPLFVPIVMYEGRGVHSYHRIFCDVWRRWIHYAR